MVHGRGFDMFAMRVFERTIPKSVNLLYVQAPFVDPQGGYCWWNIYTSQSPLEGLQELKSFLDNDLRSICRQEGLDDKADLKLSAYGFSQGAGVLSGVIQLDPSLFSQVALLAGFVLKLPTDMQEHDEGRKNVSTRVLMINGTQDEIVPLDLAKEGAIRLRACGLAVEFVENEVGHKVGVSGMRRLTEWSNDVA
jgi:predicted esterase